jgi:hypothetical protein
LDLPGHYTWSPVAAARTGVVHHLLTRKKHPGTTAPLCGPLPFYYISVLRIQFAVCCISRHAIRPQFEAALCPTRTPSTRCCWSRIQAGLRVERSWRRVPPAQCRAPRRQGRIRRVSLPRHTPAGWKPACPLQHQALGHATAVLRADGSLAKNPQNPPGFRHTDEGGSRLRDRPRERPVACDTTEVAAKTGVSRRCSTETSKSGVVGVAAACGRKCHVCPHCRTSHCAAQ